MSETGNLILCATDLMGFKNPRRPLVARVLLLVWIAYATNYIQLNPRRITETVCLVKDSILAPCSFSQCYQIFLLLRTTSTRLRNVVRWWSDRHGLTGHVKCFLLESPISYKENATKAGNQGIHGVEEPEAIELHIDLGSHGTCANLTL